MNIGIDKIFEYLSWNNSDEIQKCGIKLAGNIKNLSVLIMPIESKSIWENCAKVLVNKSDDELSLYLINIFEWLKDMNWPGADLIYDRLLRMSSEKFLPAHRYSLSVAKQTQDCPWEKALNDLYVEYIFNMIDWSAPAGIQSQGISLANDMETITPFLQPQTAEYSKNIWANCATIIFQKDDEILRPHLYKLMEWLKDMNWPGANTILDRLNRFSDKKELDIVKQQCITSAKDSFDGVWENNLKKIRTLDL